MFPIALSTSSTPNNGFYTILSLTISSIVLMTSYNRFFISTLTTKMGQANLMLLRYFLYIYTGLLLYAVLRPRFPYVTYYSDRRCSQRDLKYDPLLFLPLPCCYRYLRTVAAEQCLGISKPSSGVEIPRCRQK